MKHGLTNTRVYKIWEKMKYRCYNKNADNYKYYGAKGVVICDSWKNNPKAFCDWALANGYTDHLTIDRIDGNKEYSPDNCRWVSHRTNCLNRRTSSKTPGCYYDKKNKHWYSQIHINNKTYYLGDFNTPEEATRCYQRTREAFCE